jgi:hypothetical protein
MFWYKLAKYLFGYSSPLTLTGVNDDIVFNNFWLQNSQIITSKFNPEDTAQVEYNTFPIPKDDGTGFYSRYWRQKTITLRGIVKGSTQTDCEIAMDTMKGKLNKTEGLFKFKTQGVYRNILATCTSVVFNRDHFHINFCPFVITLQTNEPFFYEETLQSFTTSGVTGATLAQDVFNPWFIASKPQIYFVFNSATSVTTVYFTCDSRTITYTGTITASDILLIDCLNKEVRLNNTLVDYSGTFPELPAWSKTVTYWIDGTHNTDISINFRKNFL